MEPRLEVIEYLFKYYGFKMPESMSKEAVPSYAVKCPMCGGEFNKVFGPLDYADPNDPNDPMHGVTDPIELIKVIQCGEPDIKDKIIFDSYSIGDIILDCKTPNCGAEAHFIKTKLKVVKGAENIAQYMKDAYGSSNIVTTKSQTTGLEGFFTHE